MSATPKAQPELSLLFDEGPSSGPVVASLDKRLTNLELRVLAMLRRIRLLEAGAEVAR